MQLLGFVRRKIIWYLIRVKERPRKERAEERAAAHLRDSGLDVYLPTVDDAPLFGGYLFAELMDFQIIRESRTMSLPEFNEVSTRLIEQLRDTQWHTSDDTCRSGSLVRITSGPFNYRTGIIDQIQNAPNGESRVFVLLDLMGSQQRIKFDRKEIQAA